MFQFEDQTPAKPTIGSVRFDGLPDHGGTHRTLLAWAEHCVECAAPSCYSSCDLYDPTPAGKCRRFEDGVVRAGRSGGRPLAEVRFKRWGKLEAQGNAALLPNRRARLLEALLDASARPVAKLGLAITRLSGSERWATAMEALHKRLNARLQRRAADGPLPNAFVADIFNPGRDPVTLILSAKIDPNRLTRGVRADQLPRPMTTAIVAPPGATRHVVPVDEMRDILASGLPFNLALSPESDGLAQLVFGALDLIHRPDRSSAAASRASASRTLPAAKCVIFDLDNTLWDGVLLEGDVTLRHMVADLFRTLDERGILISVASKNAHEDALARLKAFGLDEYLLYPQIGWGPKSEGVRRIAKALDIGTDTLIFVDDNPFERAEVEEAVPGVMTLTDGELLRLVDHPRLQGAVTEESKRRRSMYKEAMAREDTAAAFGDDYLEFLRACGITVEIRREQPRDIERIVELVQRTNQLNFSGRKYGRDEILAILAEPRRERHVVSVSDRFGSYGLVGFCLSRQEGGTIVVEDFMLSCRVQGKFVEQALFRYLVEQSSPRAGRIIVNFKGTDRNNAARMVLDKLGFALAENGSLARDIAGDDLKVDFMTVVAGSDDSPAGLRGTA